MLQPSCFFDLLRAEGVAFFTGVPDSLLKDFCAYVTDHAAPSDHIIAANEGSAVGLAAGYHLATGKVPLVYMQNSGLGNSINPLVSLADAEVYALPLVLLIGWRGEPGVKDEPQHVKQGKVTLALLESLGIPYCVLAPEEAEAAGQVKSAFQAARTASAPFAIVVRKETFSPYKLQKEHCNALAMSREEAIQAVVDRVPKDALVVATTGMISRELYEYRVSKAEGNQRDFLTVGSMGHASQIALAIALQKPDRPIFCFDGDGAVLMHMGGLATIGSLVPRNLVHVVFNNGAHDSVGGQPTLGFAIRMDQVAQACGYARVAVVEGLTELAAELEACGVAQGPCYLEIRVRKGARKDLGRPKSSPVANKEAFMKVLE